MFARVRIVWRHARSVRLLRPVLESIDRIWWSRVIRRADVVDLDFVRAQGPWRTSNSAVRAYVRGGHRRGMSLNPLFQERLVSAQLSDAGRVPAMYAYLVSESKEVQTSIVFDAAAYTARHPDSHGAQGRALGHAWRAARTIGYVSLGSGPLASAVSWDAVHTTAVWAARVSTEGAPTPPLEAIENPLVHVVEIHSDDDGAAAALREAAKFGSQQDTTVIVAMTGRAADLWTAGALLGHSLPDARIVRGGPEIISEIESRCRTDAVIAVRGEDATISAADLSLIAEHARQHPSAPLWLAPDGTVASAGVVLHEGRPVQLLAGHPAEDAAALGDVITVSATAGGTFARRVDATATDAAITVIGAIVRAPAGSSPPSAPSGAGIDLNALLEPTSLRVDGWTASGPRIVRPPRTASLADGTSIPSLRWAIKIVAPPGEAGESWGETHFARGLADALRRLGQEVVIDAYDGRVRPSMHLDDVILALRGPEPFEAQPGAASLLWIISHPDEITGSEIADFDAVFAASAAWSEEARSRWSRPVEPLLQCTDVRRFHPAGVPRTDEIVFVGTARRIERPSVLGPVRAGVAVSVYGPDWMGWIPASVIKARGVPNADLPALYERAGVVLNDHWPAMRDAGFISNRLFDVVAAGGRAVSDDVVGIDDIFHGAVATYQTMPELIEMLRGDLDSIFPDAEQLAKISRELRGTHSFDDRARRLLDVALSIHSRRSQRPGV